MSNLLKVQVLSALRWSASLRLLSQVIVWAMTFLVIRLLRPEDYGLMAIASVAMSFAMLVNELGVGPAIIQRKELNGEILRQAFGLVVITNTVLAAALWFFAPLIARFFSEPEVENILKVFCIQFLFVSITVIPEALLVRKLNFKAKAIVELITSVAAAGVTLLFAFNGFGVWSLVFGNVIFVGLRALLMNVVSPFRKFPSFSFAGARDLITFGGLITVGRLLWFFYSRADVFIVGKFLGTELLGIYSIAMQVASLPMQKVNSIINEIAFPAFSKVQEDIIQIKNYLGKVIRLISLFAFPVFFGIASVSEPFLKVVLGEQWIGAAVPLAILSCIMPLRMISNVITSTLQGIGRVGVSVGNQVIAAVLVPSAVAVGSSWGLVGVSVSWLVAFPLVTVAMVVRSRKYVGMNMLTFLNWLFRPFLAATAMWIVVFFAGYLLAREGVTGISGLVVLIAAGAISYPITIALLDKPGLREARELVGR